ncbi:MAG TPA: hypothetical protein VH089_21040 [Streptosporangiaceae bacterium]|nr:hypothetical protein [Streptosporangiaceae bacterium]
MDSNNARRAGKQPYEAVRDQLDQLGEKVIERHWDEGAPVRQGYRRFLGAMDELAGRLLDDDEISQRGQDLRRENEPDGADESAEAGGAEAARGDAGAETEATDGAGVTDEVWTQASDEAEAADGRAAEEVQRTEEARKTEEALRADEAGVGESWAAGNTRVAEAQAAGATGAAAGAEAERTVDVVFSLPAETRADRVALCGEFNDWSMESISLVRGDDRAWRVTVPLVPGTYRYKFLLDGETWENGTDADRYEENAYGTQDSVIVVS